MHLNHILIRTIDPEESMQWYQDMLGMKVREIKNGCYFLHFGEEHHSICLWDSNLNADTSVDSQDMEPFHFAIECDQGDWDAVINRIKNYNQAYEAIDFGFQQAIYLKDPNGYTVEVMRDTRDGKNEPWDGTEKSFEI